MFNTVMNPLLQTRYYTVCLCAIWYVLTVLMCILGLNESDRDGICRCKYCREMRIEENFKDHIELYDKYG